MNEVKVFYPEIFFTIVRDAVVDLGVVQVLSTNLLIFPRWSTIDY